MATPAHRLIQDQNLSILYNGATPAGKTDMAKPTKKGALGGRKALNDISNSRKPSMFQSTKKEYATNVISIGKDSGACKGKLSKISEKGKTGGRKALGDVTNSVKLSAQPVSKMTPKLDTVVENVPCSILEEGFLHDHQKCIKAWFEAPDMNFFLESVGLCNDNHVCLSATSAFQPSPKKGASNMKYLEIEEEMPELLFEDQTPQCRSPKSPKPPYMNWGDDYFCDMRVIDSPKLLDH